jgi:hypothetical protein
MPYRYWIACSVQLTSSRQAVAVTVREILTETAKMFRTKHSDAERREKNRLRSERWRRGHGIGPRRPAKQRASLGILGKWLTANTVMGTLASSTTKKPKGADHSQSAGCACLVTAGPFDGKKLFSESNASWNGHAWVMFGHYLADVPIFRTAYSTRSPPRLAAHVRKEFGEGRGLLIIKWANAPGSGPILRP